jgi:hypothetical protein
MGLNALPDMWRATPLWVDCENLLKSNKGRPRRLASIRALSGFHNVLFDFDFKLNYYLLGPQDGLSFPTSATFSA